MALEIPREALKRKVSEREIQENKEDQAVGF